ncbi:hypothetical protein UT300007_24720 [Clostridium sp. CTA-7]
MNKKKIYIMALLLFLMFLILCMKNLFINDIRKVAISNNNIEKFNDHLLREGKYKVSLPEGWEIDEKNTSYNSDINIIFNNKNNISGNISIITGDVEDIAENIAVNDAKIIVVDDYDYTWNIVSINKEKFINKYYIRKYSEGKVLIIKYFYKSGKEKNSINVVFDTISKSFQ